MNKKIRILRGTNEKIANTPEKTLAAGQPLYNIDKNYLTIGSLKNGNEQPLSQLPITVRQIEGYYSDNDQIKNEDDGYYSVGPSHTGSLLLNAENCIEFTVRESIPAGTAGTGSISTPVTVTPGGISIDSLVRVDNKSMSHEDGKFWFTTVDITPYSISRNSFTENGETRTAPLYLNDLGGDIYLSNNNSNIIITGNISDGTNSTTVENIVTKTGTQSISGAKTFTSAVTAPFYTSDNSQAGIKISNDNEITFRLASNAEEVFFGYDATRISDANGKAKVYYFGDSTGVDGRESGSVRCGLLFEGGTALSTKYVTTGTAQTITGSKTFSGPLISTGTGDNRADIKQAFINACGMYTLNVHTINLQTTTDGNGDNIVNVPSIVNPSTGSGGGNIGYV